MINLGKFDVVSGRLAVSDPCYDEDVWCRGEIDNAKNGSWFAFADEKAIERWGEAFTRLIAVHEDYVDRIASMGEKTEGLAKKTDQLSKHCCGSLTMHRAAFAVGVDSGQAGIFDASHYRDNSVVPNEGYSHQFEDEEADAWYDYCCEITLSDSCAGVLPFGVVSVSGFGDGEYVCDFWKNADGEVVRVEIEFIAEV